MALRDSFRSIAVYFGLAEGREEYDDEPEYDAREPERDLEERYRERPNVRRLSTRRRRDEIDDIFADDSPAERRTTRLRTVEPGAGTNGGRRESSRVHLVIPKSFNDAQDIADKFKDQIPVIVNGRGARAADREGLLQPVLSSGS
jgi:cell division inhibitor SepF